MKKLLSIFIAFALVFVIFSPTSDAKMASNSPLPNLYSSKVENQLKAGTFKYRGLKIGMSQGAAVRAWGKPDSQRFTNTSRSMSGSFFYGRYVGTYFSAKRNFKTSVSNMRVYGMNIVNQNGSKYTYTGVVKRFGKPTKVFGSGRMKTAVYGKYLQILFRNNVATGVSMNNYSIR